jgi:hypothetical protein
MRRGKKEPMVNEKREERATVNATILCTSSVPPFLLPWLFETANS